MIYGFSDNKSLVYHLVNSGVLRTPDIIKAFENVDRGDFVGNTVISDIYGDYPLQIGYSQTISQPTTVAIMLEMLQPRQGQKILDIGSGSGWTTALLAYIAGERGFVTGLERIDPLVEFGNDNLKRYRFSNAKIIKAGAKLGMPGERFDRILVSAAAEEFPYELADQLKTGGRLVIPVGSFIFEVAKKENGELEIFKHYGFSFVPLILEK
ncbi:protein-L-isoaspartate O-methyltransferase [Sulfurimonas sp. HSL-1716]|uniref:protein-L-isoaspartate O-methyltransferase family protein n=1 Tax=Hydrocurvibacter sulfurireducens TaxID=3131937 RepID=UPI0031F9F39B